MAHRPRRADLRALLRHPARPIIAAELTGRRCYAVELRPAFVDVAIRRWQAFTGREATLEGDGRTFAELAVERVG